MKKKTFRFFGILLISVLSTVAFSSCDKDTWCYLDVTVLDSNNNNAPSPFAWVKVQYVKTSQNDGTEVVGTIADTGQCNAQGVYSTRFAAPAIFTIVARIDEPDTINHKLYYRQGEKSVRLKEGEVVTASVKVISDKILGRADFQEI